MPTGMMRGTGVGGRPGRLPDVASHRRFRPSTYGTLGSRREILLDSDAYLAVSRVLEAGESLIWSGVPRRGLVLRSSDAFLIPFSLLWGGFAVFWEASVIAGGAPLFFALWGVPFVLVGFYVVIGRFFVDARIRANTAYGLTNRRAIIISGIMTTSIRSLPLSTLSEISMNERRDGSGTVCLGTPHPFSAWYSGMYWPGTVRYTTPCFEMIADAKTVHDKVLAAQRSAA
jgi:hypothetical protein